MMTTSNTQVLHEAANQHESARLLQLRLTGFVGREAEQATIRELIDQTRPTGGYVLVTGEAGAGKSSLIAQLIVNAGLAQTPQHFIALTPGRAYQLDVLRSIVAQLMLKHDLASNYFPADSYPALRLEFGQLLHNLSARGISETIYLDGLDQLQPEVDGTRDLSFLPLQLPPGIMIVLGSRPNETIDSLALEHGVVYQVPPLSDADMIRRWQQVQPTLEPALLHGLARSVKGNALLVELAANVLRHTSATELQALLDQASADATKLFRLSLGRIEQAAAHHWQALIRPPLAVLVVTQEPLQPAVLAAIVEQPVAAIAEALALMSDWVSVAADQRVALRHLLFHDFLLHHEFTQPELQVWHGRMAQWCGTQLEQIWHDSAEPIEQARRWYGRQHYITHLDCAEQWEVLWQVIDAGEYGEHKVRFEPSTRLYGLDLDRARESVIAAGQSLEQQLELLPLLWRYSLLRTSLTAHADQWHDNVFVILAAVGRLSEALAQIDICSDQVRQVLLWSQVIQYAEPELGLKILQRMEQTARSIHNPEERDFGLYRVAMAYADHGLLNMAYPLAISLGNTRDETLAYLIEVAIKQHDLARFKLIIEQIQTPKYRIKSSMLLANALIEETEVIEARQLLIETLPFAQNEQVVEIKSLLATIAWRLGDHQQAHVLLAEAQTISEQLTDDAKIAALLAIIKGYLAQGNLAQAYNLHDEIKLNRFRRELVDIYINRDDIAIAVELAATITHWHSSDMAYAALVAWYCKEADFAKAEQALGLIKAPDQKIKSYCLLANSHADQFQWMRLLESAQLSLSSVISSISLAKCWLQLADAYAFQHAHDRAQSMFEHALTAILAISNSFLNDQMYDLLQLAHFVKRYNYDDLCQRVIYTTFLVGKREDFEYSLPFEHATIYLNHGEFDQVRQIIDTTASPYLAVNLLQMLLAESIKRQDHPQAQLFLLETLNHARKLEKPAYRINILCKLADIALANGFAALGKIMLNEATQLLSVVTPEDEQRWAGVDLVRRYHAYGMLSNATMLTQLMTPSESHDHIMAEISLCYAKSGEIDQAYTILKSINTQTEFYAWNLCQIIIKAHEQGLAMPAAGYYATMIEALSVFTDPIRWLKYIKDLAIAQISYGSNQYLPSLLDALRTIRHPALAEYQYVEVLCEIARAYINQGKYSDFIDWLTYAHTIAQSIVTESRPKVAAYHYVAMAYLQHATDSDTEVFLADMLRLADGIAPSSYANDLFDALANTCTAYAVRGHLDFFAKAYPFAMAISVPWQRAQALRSVANGYAKVDDRVMVEMIIAEISRLSLNYSSLDAIALIYAQRGDLAFAQTLIANDEASEERDAVLEYLVPALLQADAVVAAQQISYWFYSLDKRVEALNQIIHYYVERGQIAESIQIIQATWRNCGAAADVWELRKVVLPLDSTHPWLGMALLDSVPWVEQQLARFH